MVFIDLLFGFPMLAFYRASLTPSLAAAVPGERRFSVALPFNKFLVVSEA
jgi:hypothetical protein